MYCFLWCRYKVYLEPEEDITSQSKRESATSVRVPLQERPALAEMSAVAPLLSQKRRVTTNPAARRKSETHRPSVTTSLHQRKAAAGRRISHGIVTGSSSTTNNTGGYTIDRPGGTAAPLSSASVASRVLRMGTRTSLSALHRERLRLTSDISIPPRTSEQILTGFPGLKHKSAALDLDYDTMEYKSIMPEKVIHIK